MNAPVLIHRTEVANSNVLAELATVRLIRAIRTDDGIEVPEATVGTVVGTWAEGAAYEVEFAVGLATVDAEHLVTA